MTGSQWVGKMYAPKNGGWKLFKTGAFGNLVDVSFVCFPRGAAFLRFNVLFSGKIGKHDA